MLRLKTIAVVLVAATLIVLVPSPAVGAPEFCPKELQLLNRCPTVNTDGTNVNIDGTKTTTGTDTTTRTDTRDTVTTPVTDPITWPVDRTWTVEDFQKCMGKWESSDCTRPFVDPVETTDDETEDTTVIPSVTITDLAQFTPPPTAISAEPDDVGVVGMPANFVAAASSSTQTGTLFGYPLSVRFTPSAYVFHYGDGAEATTTTGGQSWESLGQAQFTPTATSHVYAARGTYEADVDVRYTAEVDFGFGWFPISGELTADGPTQEIRVFEARTALVAYTCDQQPGSPGC